MSSVDGLRAGDESYEDLWMTSVDGKGSSQGICLRHFADEALQLCPENASRFNDWTLTLNRTR
jgi:hypothetical protein